MRETVEEEVNEKERGGVRRRRRRL